MTRFEELHRTWQAMMAERKINVSFDTFLAIIDVADEHPESPWRKVEKELPSEDTEVVIYLRGTMVIGYRIGEGWYMHGIAIDTPTHWMPIPQVPKGGEKRKRTFYHSNEITRSGLIFSTTMNR